MSLIADVCSVCLRLIESGSPCSRLSLGGLAAGEGEGRLAAADVVRGIVRMCVHRYFVAGFGCKFKHSHPRIIQPYFEVLRVYSDRISSPCCLTALPALQLENDHMDVSAARILTSVFFGPAKNDVASFKRTGLAFLAGERELRLRIAQRVNYIRGMRMHDGLFTRFHVNFQDPDPIAVQQHFV